VEVLAACRGLRRFRSREASGADVDRASAVESRIDAVYLWRDARDPAWLSARAEALAALSAEERNACNEPDLRWLEVQRSGPQLELLRWSLRSLALHFEALGRVHIVSDTAPPAWLRIDHPDLVWIPAKDLIADPCPYPSFSSQAIESFLYRIPGLSERFIYLNDDFFLSRNVGENAFFQGERIVVRMGRGVVPQGSPDGAESGDTSALRNSNHLLDRDYVRERRLTLKHRPYALTRALFSEAESRFGDAFRSTRSHPFRSVRTYALHSCLVPYMAIYEKRACPIIPNLFRKDMIHWSNDLVRNERAFRKIASSRLGDYGFCLQVNGELEFSADACAQFGSLMRETYPESSRFECSAPPREGVAISP
jgi:hypothetical protein